MNILFNKQTITTLMLTFATAMTMKGQTFTPIVADSVDFVITGTTSSTNDSVSAFPCAPIGQSVKFPIREGKFTVTGRQPRNTFFQIGDNAKNDLRFIIEETPTHIDLVTGEIKGSDLQQRFIRCQMRERDLDKIAEPWHSFFRFSQGSFFVPFCNFVARNDSRRRLQHDVNAPNGIFPR